MSDREQRFGVPNVIKYNWELLKKYTLNNPRIMLSFFDNVYIRKSENYFYLNTWAASIVAESKNNTQNYIQNIPELIVAAPSVTDSELFVYFDLASKRSYFNFINTRGKMNYLPIWKIDTYDIDSLKMNRLLTFDENNIYLLYVKQEIKNGKSIR